MVPIPAFINASYTQPLIYNRLTANILQVPLGTSEDRRNLREIRSPGSSLKGKNQRVRGNCLVAVFRVSVGVLGMRAIGTEPVGSCGCLGEVGGGGLRFITDVLDALCESCLCLG